MPVPEAFTSSRTLPSPASATVTSTNAPADADTVEMLPESPPVKTREKSAASTPTTASLNDTRNVISGALLEAAVVFWRFTETTDGAAVSTRTANTGDEGLVPRTLDAVAWNAWVPSARTVAV